MEDQRMSNCYYVCRWSWLGAVYLTISTRAITWRWRSSSAWSFLQAEACLCPREPSTKTGRPRLHHRRTLRRQNQVGREGRLGVRERLEEKKDGSGWISYLCLDKGERGGRKLGDRKQGKASIKWWRKGKGCEGKGVTCGDAVTSSFLADILIVSHKTIGKS